MNEKEIAEIRRRLKPDKHNISGIHGCYVNEKREIVSEFHQSLALMPQDEGEKMLATLKRILSGTVGKNLIDLAFTTQQVVDSEEHKLLMTLKDSALSDGAAVQALFGRIIETLSIEGNYLILLAHDKYDVPYRSKDGETQADASSEIFSYILCGICPVKETKAALSYSLFRNEFLSLKADSIVAPPEMGFLFPAFDDRSSNIYNALYFTKDTAENHAEFVEAVFHTEIPMPAAAQKESFDAMLEDTFGPECSYENVQTVHDQLCGMIAEHKETKQEAPLVVSKGTVKQMLQSCGVTEERVTKFEEQYDATFGAQVDLSPRNIVDDKQFEVRTPEVLIRTKPEHSNLVETRIIDGKRYILVRVNDDVKVNGVSVQIFE